MKRTLLLAATLASMAAATGLAGAPRAADPTPQAVDRGQTKTLTVRSTRFGRILFDGRGHAIYGFTRDKQGDPSRCYGECAKAWPVYFKKGMLRAGAGVTQSELGTTKRRDGRLQVTYNGWPLYFYAHEGPGEVKCQNVEGFGGLWLVVRANGTLVR